MIHRLLDRLLLFVFLSAVVSMAPLVCAAGKDSSRVIELRLESLNVTKANGKLLPERPRMHAIAIRRTVRDSRPVPVERNPELSEQHLVVVAVDAKGREIARRLVLDPRLLRVETADPSGRLSGEVLYRSDADLSVTFPDRPGMSALKIYQPHWSGTDFALQLLGEATLP
ncbi:MAG: hypothetical protein Q7J84_16665 [Sulfuricaulis sp.]|nr:hypothetical protein [Sulfuricaulis sp.]